ncbi:hypothetical protein [Mucilaginibacter antarcticus]|uniref:hypothetical protein n=1 Tax=Mucilaginibacter antarcticus TaxID=1855725 RepID=UPI00362D1AC0
MLQRTDERKVKDLWVINSIAEPRPTLETYKYHLPGEKDSPLREMYLFEFGPKTYKKLVTNLYKDQELGVWGAHSYKNSATMSLDQAFGWALTVNFTFTAPHAT